MRYDELRARLPYYRSLDAIVGPPAEALPLTANAVVYSMAQQVAWLTSEHFGVARWNGVVSVYDAAASAPQAPVAEVAVVSPSGEGVQMLAAGDGSTWFVTSNDGQSLAVWPLDVSGDDVTIGAAAIVGYDAAVGVANSGLFTPTASGAWLVTGHESGYLLVWDATDPSSPQLQQVVDLTSSSPTNPWNLQNVRAIEPFDIAMGSAIVVTGSENGNVCLVQVPSGNVLTTTVYNPSAQRGINTVATNPPWILVGNCAVGPDDKNLWCFKADDSTVTRTGAVNLVVDTSLPQVFDFSVSFVDQTWYAATQEGALWGGTINADGSLAVIGHDTISAQIGAATAYGGPGELVVAAYDIHTYEPTS